MSDILPCPFVADHIVHLQDAGCFLHGAAWRVWCDGCGIYGPTRKTGAEAIAAWNTRRAAPDMVLVPVEPTEAMLERAYLCDPLSCDFNEKATALYCYKHIWEAMLAASKPTVKEDETWRRIAENRAIGEREDES